MKHPLALSWDSLPVVTIHGHPEERAQVVPARGASRAHGASMKTLRLDWRHAKRATPATAAADAYQGDVLQLRMWPCPPGPGLADGIIRAAAVGPASSTGPSMSRRVCGCSCS